MAGVQSPEIEPRFGLIRPRLPLAGALAALLAACAGDGAPAGPADFLVRFQVTNALVAPVTLSVDGTPHVRLSSGQSIGLAVPSTAQWLTWTSAKPMDSRGTPIPDDIGEVRVAISGINGALEIRNVIDDRTYITAGFFNATSAQVSIGVYDGSSVSCAAVLPPRAGTVSGFVQIGYYRLLPATELRAYRDPSRCTGPYVAWPRSQLGDFEAKSGLLTLVLDSPP